MPDVAAPAPATAPTLKQLRVKIGREVRYLWVEAETHRQIENFDRYARRRARLFRDHHVTGCTEAELSMRTLNRPDKPVRVYGLLNALSEPASDRLGLTRAADKPGRWEGPRVAIDRLLGECRTWSGHEFGALVPRPYGGPHEPQSTQLVLQYRAAGVCPVCRGQALGGLCAGEVVIAVACLGCGRTNVEHWIGGAPRPRGARGGA